MRIVPILLSLSLLLFACRSSKQIQKIEDAISAVDTTGATVIKDTAKNDTANVAAELYNKVLKNHIDFNTFNAKVRVEYMGQDGGDDATAYIRIQKDSAIWLSLRGPLGIEGFRMLVTKDSVKVLDLQKKTVQFKSISYLNEISGLPVDFNTLQDLIIGNPVFIDSHVVSYKVTAGNELLVQMKGKTFNNLLMLDNTDYKVMHSKLDDVATNRTCDITFSDYENTAGRWFSKKRKIVVTAQSTLEINLDYKQFTFNEPVTFPFNISANYKRL